jgi:phosphatidylglycerophosphatase A
VGLFPIAPATAASFVVALLLYIAPAVPPTLHAALLAVLFFVGVRAATLAERSYGTDGGEIVVDEVVGMGIALFLAPHRPLVFLAAFLLFRFFDIVKPWPIRRLEDLPGGWGIMSDDALAGIYSLAVLHLGLRLAGGAS